MTLRERSNVSIVGATGLVGETLLRVLQERQFPINELRLYASARSSGVALEAFGKRHTVEDVTRFAKLVRSESESAPSSADLVFFASSSEVSLVYAQAALQAGAFVIDKSSAFRLNPRVPLVIPEVNADAMSGQKLVANPNCASIPLAMTLFPVLREFGLQWMSVSTYQSVSGAGKDALAEMQAQQRGDERIEALPRRIAGNVIPENGTFDEDGHSEEERKIAAELKKLMGCPELRVSATSVRVPVAVGHAAAVSFGTLRAATRQQLQEVLSKAPGIRFLAGANYATPLEVAGTDDVVVGRLRADLAHPGAFTCWVVCDNLRKGAATNAVQIAETVLGARAALHA
ncbi:MAG: aspartate-semialdehyde dehydrogenase [Candidatus Eremiobacteraeota bacterium]|nr:aspartate-semialdehyde dehydrogenase [Candidatus Eremiobacteraeota bacterium]